MQKQSKNLLSDWTCEARWESDGSLIDPNNPIDRQKLNDLQVRAMSAIGYKFESAAAV
jgi:hypothetical protein